MLSRQGLEALAIISLQKSGGIKGFFSRRAIIYGGPVLKENNSLSLLKILETIESRYARNAIYIEIRNLNDYKSYSELFLKKKWEYVPYLNIIVDCTDKEKLFQGLSNNRKRQIRKSIDSGVKIREALELDEVVQFYSILEKLYRGKVKKPLLPQQFFEESFKLKFCKFLLVVFENRIIGGIMFPVLKDKCIYEFYVCGLDEEFKNQYPSVLATWAGMTYATNNGIKMFDFMGAGIRNMDYGVREFKERFGGETVEYGRYLKINNIFLYKAGRIYLKLLKNFKH